METNFISKQLTLFENVDGKARNSSQKAKLLNKSINLPVLVRTAFCTYQAHLQSSKWTIELAEVICQKAPLLNNKKLRWVDPANFEDYPMAAPQKKMVQKYFKN